MAKVYITTAISPMMLPQPDAAGCHSMVVVEHEEHFFRDLIRIYRENGHEIVGAVGHPNTASLLEAKFGLTSLANRVSITLEPGDRVLAAVPQFRPPESREFSDNEIRSAKFRYFEALQTG